MAHGKSLFYKAIQVTKLFTANPSYARRMTRDRSEVTTYPDGSQYIWHNGSRRKTTTYK